MKSWQLKINGWHVYVLHCVVAHHWSGQPFWIHLCYNHWRSAFIFPHTGSTRYYYTRRPTTTTTTEEPFRCRLPQCPAPPTNCTYRLEYQWINGVWCPVGCNLECDGPIGELNHQPWTFSQDFDFDFSPSFWTINIQQEHCACDIITSMVRI